MLRRLRERDDAPPDVVPVAHVAVLVHDDDPPVAEVRVGRVDDLLGLAFPLDGGPDDDDAARARVREVHLPDVGEAGLADQRVEDGARAHERAGVVLDAPADEAEVDGALPVGDGVHPEDEHLVVLVVEAGRLAVRPVVVTLARDDLAFQDVLGLRRHHDVAGLALDQLHRATRPCACGLVLGEPVLVLGNGSARREDEQRVHADGDGARRALALRLVLEDVDCAVAVARASVGGAPRRGRAHLEVALDLHGGVVAVDDHGAVLPHVVRAGLGVDRDDARSGGDVAPAVQLVPERRGDLAEVDVLAEDLHLLDGAVVHRHAREAVGHPLLDDVVQLHPVPRPVEGDGQLVERVHDVGDQLLVRVVLDVLEQQAGACPYEVAVADRADLEVEVDLGGDALEQPALLQDHHVLAHALVRDGVPLRCRRHFSPPSLLLPQGEG